jgi:hypothetical protein
MYRPSRLVFCADCGAYAEILRLSAMIAVCAECFAKGLPASNFCNHSPRFGVNFFAPHSRVSGEKGAWGKALPVMGRFGRIRPRFHGHSTRFFTFREPVEV